MRPGRVERGRHAHRQVTAAPPTVSHHYGYGLLDAGQLVDMARTWLPTRPQQKCAIQIVHTST